MRTRVLGGLIVLLACHGLARAEDVTVIRAGRLIDTESGRVLEAQTIVVRDGIIADLGPNLEAPSGAKVIDLGGYTVLPGLMDAHTHLTIDQGNQDPLGEL
jgi:imidazolonepropionase-like amidohydrolase